MLFAAALTAVVVGVFTPSADAGQRRQMIRAINFVRSVTHHRHVRFSNRLARGASSWARHLVARNTLAHSARAIAHGEGEIIEWHTGRRARVNRTVVEWLHSAEHRVVMLSGRYHRAGAGKATGYMGGRKCTIWVVRFAR